MSSRTSAIRCRCSSGRTSTDYNEKGTVNSDDKGETQNDVFDIPSKKARRIKKWRQATLALNVTRWFMYTLNFIIEEQNEETISKIEAHAQAVRAVHRFEEIGGKTTKEDGIANSDDKGEMQNDIFDIQRKRIERLKKWRQATLALNVTRQFRYTLNFIIEEQNEETISKIKAHAQAVRAAHRFEEIGSKTKKEDGWRLFLVIILHLLVITMFQYSV